MFRNISLATALVAASFAVSGCTMMQSGSVVSNTNFAYPNSNVTPIGETSESSFSLCGFLGFPITDPAEVLATTIDKAVHKRDGDLLINARVTNTAANIAIFTFCNTTVAGTAAKMQVGQQELR